MEILALCLSLLDPPVSSQSLIDSFLRHVDFEDDPAYTASSSHLHKKKEKKYGVICIDESGPIVTV